MITIGRNPRRAPAENTVALVNIVFLMLIFFLIAGAIAPPLDKDLSLIDSSTAEPVAPPDAFAAHADGTLHYRGRPVTISEYMAGLPSAANENEPGVELIADRSLPAVRLVEIVSRLKQAGAKRVAVITRRAAP